MSQSYEVGTQVKWKWGNGWGHGKITDRFTRKTTRKIDGTEVTRDADEECPAYLIEQDDGDRVLKSHSEIQADS
ncbi:MAG: DUF2945 domain-containing protein [Planctomycetota bacterium]|nr:MAG: DUF2945 domain-containing protein [Planctomycetota bacterium]